MKNNEVHNHKHIAFVEDHVNPLGLIRSLGEVGINPIVILVGYRPILIPACKYIAKLHKVKSAEEGFDVLLREYGHGELKPFVYTCNDSFTSFLDMRYNQIKDLFYFFNGGSEGRITQLMNKDAINQLAVRCGCKIPKTEVVKKGELPTDLQYPVFTKAINSLTNGWKDDSYVCQNEDELRVALSKINSSHILVQEYIVKKAELGLDGISFNEGKNLFIPFQGSVFRFTPKSYGKYRFWRPMKEDELLRPIQNILREAKFTGIFQAEFLIDQKEQYYFLEVNFRASAICYASTQGGCNLPYLWAKATLKGELAKNDYSIKTDVFSSKDEIWDFKYSVIGGKVSLWKWIKEVRKCDCLYYYNKKDKKPFFAKLLVPIFRIFK